MSTAMNSRAMRLVPHAVFLVAVVVSSSAWENSYAGILRPSSRHETNIELTVEDSSGRPVEGATMWEMYEGIDPVFSGNIRQGVMERIVNRFAKEADYFPDGPIQGMLVHYSDVGGQIFLAFGPAEFGRDATLPVHVAAIKRGYEPEVRSMLLRSGRHQKITIMLRPESASTSDASMLEFDRLRSAAATVRIRDEEERQRYLADIERRMREVGKALESQDRHEDASLVYLTLAHLPSVDLIRDQSGRIIGRGYTKGYDPNNERRVADLDHAMAINPGNPNWQISLAFRRAEAAKAMIRGRDDATGLRRAYIDVFERLAAANAGRLWPSTFAPLPDAYLGERDYPRTCEALSRSYSTEPAYRSPDQWWALIEDLNAALQRRGVNGPYCEIAGLEPPSAQFRTLRER